jgi:hypothetical protein
MASYGFTQTPIDSLDEIDLDKSNKLYYTYKGCDFYYKRKDSSEKLVVGFHGSIHLNFSLPIFRFFHYNLNVLCISDMLVKKYREKNLECAWYLCEKDSNFNDIYIEILSYFIKPTLYTDAIFTGSSAGGFPSIYYATHFNSTALVMNSQFYLNKYIKFKQLTRILGLSESDFTKSCMETIIKEKGLPKKLIIYINTRDYDSYNNHYIPFKGFLEGLNTTNTIIEFNEFYGRDPEPTCKNGHHDIQLPKFMTVYDILVNYLGCPTQSVVG